MDNFDLRKYLVENKVTTNSRMMNENEEDFSVELLVPKVYFNVKTGELAKTPAAFGARSELKNMDITNYSDGEELIEWVFDGSLEKAKYFEKKYPGLFKVVGGSKMVNEYFEEETQDLAEAFAQAGINMNTPVEVVEVGGGPGGSMGARKQMDPKALLQMLEREKASFDEDSDEGEEVIYDFEAGEGYPGAKLAVMFGDQYEYVIYQKG